MKFSHVQQSQIAATGFFVSVCSYIGFWLLDVWHPGLVARFFSVHIFLLGIVGFGVWWGEVIEVYVERVWMHVIGVLLATIGMGVVGWRLGAAFGGAQLLLCCLFFLTPFFLYRLVKYK